MTKPDLIPDPSYPGMYRFRLPDGRLSGMTNLARAKEALICWREGLPGPASEKPR